MASWGWLSAYRQSVTARAHDLPARDVDVPCAAVPGVRRGLRRPTREDILGPKGGQATKCHAWQPWLVIVILLSVKLGT